MKNKKIKVNLKNTPYNIHLGKNIKVSPILGELNLGKKILIVSQKGIPTKLIGNIEKQLKKSYKVFKIILPSGESAKHLKNLTAITDCAIENKFERNDSLLSIGGGVVSDVTGFAASIYYRGINFITIPTTLLSMVDASVGGKTGINIKQGKNLLGTFYQPRTVIIDTNTLSTLPKREYLIGLSEVIKYAYIEESAKCKFPNFYKFLLKNNKQILERTPNTLNKIIEHSVKVKASVVTKDERESNLRAILNYGHTFAHGIEQAYNYKKYTHGEAVSIGMCLAAKLGCELGMVSEDFAKDTIETIKSFKLPTKITNSKKANDILNAMLLDKKVKNGKLRFVLPSKKLGKVEIIDGVKPSLILRLIKQTI